MNNIKLAALKVATLSWQDTQWVLSRLTPEQRTHVERALTELNEQTGHKKYFAVIKDSLDTLVKSYVNKKELNSKVRTANARPTEFVGYADTKIWQLLNQLPCEHVVLLKEILPSDCFEGYMVSSSESRRKNMKQLLEEKTVFCTSSVQALLKDGFIQMLNRAALS
jgi:hypothetical protein